MRIGYSWRGSGEAVGSIVARKRIGGDVLITHAECITYVESATRNEYWVDYSIYELYITNASIKLIKSTDMSILEDWSVDFPA